MAENILSQRRKEKFAHDGFLYIFDKYSKTDISVKFWRCEQLGRCKGRIHTKDGQYLREVTKHSHDSSAVSIEVAAVMTQVKHRAEDTVEGPAEIINGCFCLCWCEELKHGIYSIR